MWKAYDCLKDEGYEHLRVNHSLHFVDPDTGAHTQRMESTWWAVKRGLPRTGRSKNHYDSYLAEWLWRRAYKVEEPFLKFIEHIAEIYPVNNNAAIEAK